MGVPVATLEMQIVADVARLQKDMRDMQRAVDAATGGMTAGFGRSGQAAANMAKDLKAANENAAVSARQIQALKAQLDPAWAAQQKFNEQQKVAMAAFRSGAIDRQQFIAHMREINAAAKEAGDGVARAGSISGMQRAGLSQLAMNLSDVSTMYSLGAKTSQIFASQSGQVVQAVIMLAGETSKFAKFLQGPWGIAVTAATLILAPFIGKLFETEDKSNKAKKATESLAEQLDLAKHSWEEAADAAAEYNGEQERARTLNIASMEAIAKGTALILGRAMALREELAVKLESEKLAADIAARTGEGGGELLGVRRAADIEKRIAANEAKMKTFGELSTNIVRQIGGELAKLQTDDRYAIEQRFIKARAEAGNLGLSTKDLAAKLADLNNQEEKALEAVNKHRRRAAETLKLAQVTGQEIARALGTSITSGLRTPAHNRAAKGAANSYHLIGQAIDIPLTVNGKPLTKAGIRAILEPMGVEIKELLGPGDAGHSDHFHIAFDKMRLAPDAVARATAEAREKVEAELEKQAQAWRDLADEVDGIVMSGVLSGPKMFAQMANVDNATLLGKDPAVNDKYVADLNEVYAGLQKIRDLTPELRLGEVFGQAGTAIEGMIGAIGRLQAVEMEYQAQRQKFGDDPKFAKEMAEAEKARGRAKVGATMDMLSASKKFFKEESAGYKIITAAEKVLAAIELANTIKSIMMDTVKTTSSVANAGVRTAADTAAGGAKMFSFLGPFAFPVVAAMIAVMASLGFKGGGSAAPAIPTAEELQDAAGTGSVLGDTKAKSNSIANSLEIVAANTNKDLEYSNAMLIALRSIDTSIAAMAGQVARQITVSGSMFDTSGLRLGSNGSGGFLGMFSSSTTRELWDLGLDLASSTVGNIISNGITGSTYQIVQQIKKSSGFFGIGGGTKTTYETTTGAIDPGITEAIGNVLASLKQGLLAAAKVVGFDGAEAIIDNFQVQLGRISFKDMTGEEIEDQLNAIFSKVGDDLAGAILPGLKEMQQIGEGLFETFMRVAREYKVVDVSLQSIGMAFGAVGVASLKARDDLVQLFGGLDEFTSAVDFYRDNFLTDAERIAPIYSAVTAELDRLGLASVDTIDKFKAVVGGLDLTTEAGRSTFAALMTLAPAFKAVEDYQAKQVKAYQDQIDSLSAYEKTLVGTGTASTFAGIAAQFRTTAAAAARGDLAALGSLKGDATAYLDAARERATNALDYARARAEVMNSVENGISAAETQIELAQQQVVATQAVAASVEQLNSDMNELQMQVAANTSQIGQALAGVIDGDTIRVSNDGDNPLAAVVTA